MVDGSDRVAGSRRRHAAAPRDVHSTERRTRWPPARCGRVAAIGGLLLIPVLLAELGSGAPAGAYQHPVEAPVSEGFDAPEHAYGPGNRGQDYRVTPGQDVRAVGDGITVFSGWVAGQEFITVLHPDGLRSSYSPVADRVVQRGDRVREGQVIGHTASRFQLGVRRGATYLDPATIIGDAVDHAVLVG